jgi:energy-coupling factor transporter ATP-binding protein EcfA2
MKIKPFNHNYFLGYVNEITPQYIKIHFPSSTLLSKFHFEGVNYAGGNVGNFVVIEGEEYGFLARITKLYLPDSERKEISEKAIEHSESNFHPSGEAELLLSFSIFEPNKIQKTVSKFPCIGAKVYSCSDEQIGKYVQEFGKKEIDNDNIYATLGKLTANNADCRISLNSLFGRHCAVVGTTGGGKSWTVSKLIETIINETENKVILIDATGEYKSLTDNSISFGENVSFPHKYLNNSDFCFLFQERSPNTVSALCEAIHTLKLIKLGKLADGVKIGKNSIDINKQVRENAHLFKNCDFDITKLSVQLANECVKVGRNNIYEEDNFKLGYTSHLISRANLFFNNDAMCSALGISSQNQQAKDDIIKIITDFIKTENTNRILRIGFEKLSYDFSIREIIVDFISSFLLKQSRNNVFRENPLVMFIDEAHQFLNKRINAEDNTTFSLQSIDLIAKECRKYGLFLCLSTQMPRDIPIGTLSQMGTFIVHRLINDKDKQSIENAASSANKSALSFLPILGEGEALLVGVDFPMPLLLKIDEPIKKPISNTPRLKKKQQ